MSQVHIPFSFAFEYAHRRRSGVKVPGIRMVDAPEGVLGLEWIDGASVRNLIPGGAEEEVDGPDDEEEEAIVPESALVPYRVSVGAYSSLYAVA